MLPRLRRSALAPWPSLGLALAAACGGAITSVDRATPVVAEVVVAPLTATVVVGNSIPLQASVRDASGAAITGPAIVWSVQDTTIASVSPAGVVTARAVGSTQVAASVNGTSGLATITVMPVPVASVSVAPARVDLTPGARATLAAIAYDAAGRPLDGRAIVWASSNPDVATVDASGSVVAVAAGSATISATSEGISGTASVSVAIPAIASVVIQPRSATLQRGESVQLAAAVTDASGAAVTNRTPTWTSTSPAVAIVSASGLVSAIAPGTASVVASLDGKADTVGISVVAVPVGSVTVQPATATLAVGQGATLTATVKDANGSVVTDRAVSWTTSNAVVASVTQAGVVKALSAGTAIIAATSDGRTGSATITVTAAPVATIALQPSSVTLQRSMTTTLTATLKDASGNVLSGRTIAWSSSDTTIARVSASGVVTAVRLGLATITATSEGRSAGASVSVVAGPVDHIVISPSSVDNLRAGRSVQLSATAVDANGDVVAGAVFTWHSSSTQVATVSASGLVTGVRTGTTTITATSSGKTGSVSVRVR
jgi:uncharacterized protein YjdB